jgi:phytoene dehydrogenase-like protein
MADTYDIVVIGSGANGLTAAAYMAKAGHKVLVLERSAWFGGGVATREVVAPGFRHDLHSATHIIIQANPLIRNDELGLISKFGLKYIYPEGVFSTIFDDQTSIVSYADIDRTCQSIAKISPHDADAYRRFAAKSQETLPLIAAGMFVPPVPQGSFWALLDQSPQGRELMRIMQSSMLDIVNEWFEHDKTKVHLLKFAAETLVGPDEKGTGMILYSFPAFVHTYRPGLPEGGSGALVDALTRCLESHGAELRKDTAVEKVIVERGRATGVRLKGGEVIKAKTAVIGQIHPYLLDRMVDGLDERLVANAKRALPASFALMAAHYALNEDPKYHAGDEPARVSLANFAPATLERYRRVFDDFKYGDLSHDQIIAAHVNSSHDPTRAPPGKAALTLFGFAPFQLRDGGSAAWDDRKAEVAELLHRAYGHYVSNLEGNNIVGRKFETPLDVQRYSPTFQNADVGGVGKYFNQIGGHRPTPELAQYAVPGAERLYLAGTFMHPPGGVTGGGRATAIKMCRDLKIDFDKMVASK